MPFASKPGHDSSRIDELASRCLIDSDARREWDAIIGLASHICGTHVAALRLAEGPQWRVKSVTGLREAREIRSAAGFCAYAMHDLALAEVRDALDHPPLRDAAIVRGDPFIRFYCGVPLIADGQMLGAIAIFDSTPQALSIEQHWALRQLAVLAARLLAPGSPFAAN